MYEAFFGLREKPFALTPNTGFLVQLAPYQACLNLLRVALEGLSVAEFGHDTAPRQQAVITLLKRIMGRMIGGK